MIAHNFEEGDQCTRCGIYVAELPMQGISWDDYSDWAPTAYDPSADPVYHCHGCIRPDEQKDRRIMILEYGVDYTAYDY